MHSCIFAAHCIDAVCDNSCPKFVETSYLLERNGITDKSSVFQAPPEKLSTMSRILTESDGKLKVIVAEDSTVTTAELFTYCAICHNWSGSRLHCSVYNLRYSLYMEELKKSWSIKTEPESLEYMRIWAKSAKVLIISGMDYVHFGDFESQTLLNILQERGGTGQTTIIILPKPIRNKQNLPNDVTSGLIGKNSDFFRRLTMKLREGAK